MADDYSYTGNASDQMPADSSPSSGAFTGAMSGAALAAPTGNPWIIGGAAVLGAAISIFGGMKSASDQAEIDHRKAMLAEQQAEEIAAREAINEDIRNQATFKSKLDFASQFAASGHEGTGIGSQLEIQRQGDLANALSSRDAAFQEKMLREGGSIQNKLADSTMSAGYFNSAGTAIGLGGRFAATNWGQGSPTALPQSNRPSFSGG